MTIKRYLNERNTYWLNNILETNMWEEAYSVIIDRIHVIFYRIEEGVGMSDKSTVNTYVKFLLPKKTDVTQQVINYLMIKNNLLNNIDFEKALEFIKRHYKW